MKIKVEKEKLSNALQTVQNIIPGKSPLPILSNILFQTHKGTLRLIATDLDIGISISIPTEIMSKGSITLPARKISSIIKDLPEEKVEIIVKKNNSTVVKSGSCLFKLIGIDAEEFPSLPKIEKEDEVKISTSLLKNMLQMTSFSVSRDESRYVLNGLLFIIKDKKMTLVATDGRRLALKKENINVNKSCNVKVIIPSKTITKLEKVLDGEEEVVIGIGENQILFQFENMVLISRLIEGEFPDYNQVIPKKSDNKFFVNKNTFLSALRRATILTTKESLGVRLDITKENMVISKNTPDVGELKEEISGEYNGKDISIGFNPGYLIDVLKNLPQEDIGFELTHPEKPGVIRVKDEYIYLALPMQLG